MWVSLALLVCSVAFWHRTLASRGLTVFATLAVLVGLLLLVAYGVIDRLTGSGIDASVLYHLQTGLDGAGVGALSGLAAGGAAAVLASFVAAGLTYRLVRGGSPVAHGRARRLAGFALLAGAFFLNPAVGDLGRLAASNLLRAAAVSDPPPSDFAIVELVDFTGQRRNFVLLYLESVERTYWTTPAFPG